MSASSTITSDAEMLEFIGSCVSEINTFDTSVSRRESVEVIYFIRPNEPKIALAHGRTVREAFRKAVKMAMKQQ